jgi:tetratricopeptide (TPR) repeat protein
MAAKMKLKKYWLPGVIGLIVMITGAWMGYTSFSKQETAPSFGYHALKINGAFVSPEVFFQEKNRFFMRWRRDANMLRKTEEEKTDLLLDEIINRVVMDDYLFHHSGITVTLREADEYINRYIKTKFASPSVFNAFMHDANYTSEVDLQKAIKLYLLKLKCFSKIAKEMGVTVPPAELDSLYGIHIGENRAAVTRHILIADPDRVKAQQRAAALYRQLEDGADFSALAERYSSDEATKSAGGLQPPFSSASATPLVAETVFKSRPGELLAPLPAKSGYEIIRVDRFIDYYHPKPEFSDMVLMEKFGTSDRFKTWIEGIKSKSSIEILDPAMKAYRLYRHGRYNDAGALYEKVFRKRHKEAHLQRAVECYRMTKNWKKVLRLSGIGIEKYPHNIDYRLHNAEALYRKGRVDDALKVMKDAESRIQGSVVLRESVIQMYATLGLAKEAERVKNTLSN